MGYLSIRHNFDGDSANYIIAVPRKTTAPLTNVICTIDGVAGQTRKVYPAPYGQVSLLIEGLDNAWYNVIFYRSSDGTTLDEEILRIAGNAASGQQGTITRKVYTVGGGGTYDPNDGDSGLRDPALMGEQYWIEERGTGPMKDSEYTDRSDDGGGFDWNDGKVFTDGGVYTVFIVGTSTEPSTNTGGGDFSDIYELTEDEDYDAGTMGGKVIVVNGSDTVVTLAIPNLSLVPDSKFRMTTHGGSQRNAIIQFDAGDTVEFLRGDENKVILGEGEEIEIVFKDNTPYVTFYSGEARVACSRILSDTNGSNDLNRLPADGTQYQQSYVPRVMWQIDRLGIPTVTEAQWAATATVDGKTVYPNKSKFARDDVGGTIRFPDDRDFTYRALKNLDGTTDPDLYSQGAGGRQLNSVGPHVHDMRFSVSAGGYAGGSNTFARGQVAYAFGNIDLMDDAGIGIGTKTKVDSINLFPLIII